MACQINDSRAITFVLVTSICHAGNV
jgi:hypothetical protein